MPDIVRLRWLGDTEQQIPALGQVATPDQLIEFPGRIIDDPAEMARRGYPPAAHCDCLLIEFGNPPQVQAFPHSLYGNETPLTVSKSKGKE